MSDNPKPFIPSWLDGAGLSQPEFRIYCHLCRRADNKSGIAWPAIEGKNGIIATCGMARRTVQKTLNQLEKMGLIQRIGKPFGGSNRYKILTPIGANEALIDDTPIGANEALPIGANEALPIGANEALQRFSIEGSPRRKSSASADSNSAPIGTAFEASAKHLITWEQTEKITTSLHEAGRHDSDSPYGTFPPEEVMEWARQWHGEYKATGGYWKGSKIRKPEAALEAWLRQCANNQSKRFKQLSRAKGNMSSDFTGP
jgi:DNA-binding MarR family transcriptional regulator